MQENQNQQKDQINTEKNKPVIEEKNENQYQIDNKEIKEKKYYKCTVPGCEMIFSKKCVLRDHQMAHKGVT